VTVGALGIFIRKDFEKICPLRILHMTYLKKIRPCYFFKNTFGVVIRNFNFAIVATISDHLGKRRRFCLFFFMYNYNLMVINLVGFRLGELDKKATNFLMHVTP
jgi:MoaA/NifB/PqqE/SkfB family radical SAM enzyme